MLDTLKNYYQISGLLHTSAQPTEEQIRQLKNTDITCVINLARADSPGALPNEAQVVQENKMDYIHIPVDFKQPVLADLRHFFNAMREHENKKTLVHCALNWRVSCFVYLYRVINQECDKEAARKDMLAIWEPDDTWQSFIDDALSNAELFKDTPV